MTEEIRKLQSPVEEAAIVDEEGTRLRNDMMMETGQEEQNRGDCAGFEMVSRDTEMDKSGQVTGALHPGFVFEYKGMKDMRSGSSHTIDMYYPQVV